MTIFTKSRASEKDDFIVEQDMSVGWISNPISSDLQISITIMCCMLVGDATGILQLQAACGGSFYDGSPDLIDWVPITVVTLTSGTWTAVNGTPVVAPLLSSNVLFETTSGANWFRLQYYASAGTGTMSASYVKKTWA